MGRWSNLTALQKAAIIQTATDNGNTDLNEIIKLYNEAAKTPVPVYSSGVMLPEITVTPNRMQRFRDGDKLVHLHEGKTSDSNLHTVENSIPTVNDFITQKLDSIRNDALQRARNTTETVDVKIYDPYAKEHREARLNNLQDYAQNKVDNYPDYTQYYNNMYNFYNGNVQMASEALHRYLLETDKRYAEEYGEYEEAIKNGDYRSAENCIGNLSRFYPHGLPIGNQTFAANPAKYGFKKIETENIQPGDLVQTLSSYRGTPVHAMMYNGKIDGVPTFNYSSGNLPVFDDERGIWYGGWGANKYFTDVLNEEDDELNPNFTNIYTYVGTPQDSVQWTNEWMQKYGTNVQYKDGGKIHIAPSKRGRFTENLYNRIVPIPALMPHGPIIGGITQYLKNSDSAVQNFLNNFNLEESIQAIKDNSKYKYMAERLEPFLLEDLKDLYLGMPQRNNTFELSKYKPSNATESNYYHSPVMENTLAPHFISALNDIKTGNIKPSSDKFGSGQYFDIQSITPSGNAVTILPGLGHATLGNGYDNGEYISYYDKWNVGNFTPNTDFILDKFYDVPNIYGRIYLDDYYNVPEEKRGATFLPEITVSPQYKDGGSIHIKPSKRGTFTAAATKHGKSVQEFARQVLANKDNYSPAMVKKANFARNFGGHKHVDGGYNLTSSPEAKLFLDDYAYRAALENSSITPDMVTSAISNLNFETRNREGIGGTYDYGSKTVYLPNINKWSQQAGHEIGGHYLRNELFGNMSAVSSDRAHMLEEALPNFYVPLEEVQKSRPLQERLATNTELRAAIIQNTGLSGKALDEYVNNMSDVDLLSLLYRKGNGYITGSKVPFMRREVVLSNGQKANIDDYIDLQTVPEGHTAKDWLGISEEERQQLIKEYQTLFDSNLTEEDRKQAKALRWTLLNVAQNNNGFQKSDNTYLAALGGNLKSWKHADGGYLVGKEYDVDYSEYMRLKHLGYEIEIL